jgi:ketosteroid isomerase-like protein
LEHVDQDLAEARQTMLDIYKGFEALDAEKLDANFAHSPELITFGTDWDEKFVGWEQYKDVHKMQFGALKSFKFQTRELDVQVNGATAWASDRPHWEIETKGGEKVKEDVRITAVLKKLGSDWRVVQWHVSVGLGKRLHEY